MTTQGRTAIAALLLLAACGCAPRGLTPRQGYLTVPGGRVWYQIVGHGSKTPLLVLHGGPGGSSHYLKPLTALADERPVVFYDQLGGGRSPAPNDTTLWTVDRFIAELESVRQQLGLKEVHVLGHSWGTMLAVDSYLAHPEGVRSMILASPSLSIPMWMRDADTLRHTLPDSTQQTIARAEQTGAFDSPPYRSAMDQFYHRYLSRSNPWSPDIDSTFALLGQSVYLYMQGPSEFTITGTLETYDRTPRLHEIKVPVLFTCGRYDEARPSTVAYYQSLVPGAQLAILENSGHMTMQDEPEQYVRVVREFLHRAESH